ncbi:outer membrane protein assembly factor BamD [Candidatus Pelagibacter sp.]|nr:outer membrane protein assembly factor BamD [Candidatus Pelagibacter sp.]
MFNRFSIIHIFIFILLFSCSKKNEPVSTVQKKNLETQMIEVYNEGVKEFERGDVIYAGKKFSEAELLFPQSIWAPRAVLMSAYGYFSQGYYGYAINDLERFIVKYKNHPQTDYAYYLLALCHYDQIIDEKKDMNEMLKSKKYFEFIINNFPETDYAKDSKYKLQYIHEIMASKEIYLARYYVQREKWIPAIKRFQIIINEYDTTIYVEEALHRLVELNYKIGLVSEAEKYALLLGYNYKSSEWYEASYKLLNKEYKIKKISKKEEKETILKKFKKLFK